LFSSVSDRLRQCIIVLRSAWVEFLVGRGGIDAIFFRGIDEVIVCVVLLLKPY